MKKTRPKEDYDTRDIIIKFRVSNEEAEQIERKFQNSGYKSKSDFIRIMIFQGQIIKVSDEFVRDFRRKYSSISNNINQIALRLNASGNIYAEDIAEIKNGVSEIWQQLNYFRSVLLKVKPLSEVHKQCDDLNLAELSSAVDNPLQNEAVARAYYEKAVGQTLIFATTVQHAYHIAELIDGAVVVTAETQNRAEIIERFTNREIPCLVNCMVFTEGTDMPLIETVIIARPTRNASLYTQMVGRGLRTHEGKDALNLIDCVGITGKLDICQAPDLFGISEIPKDIPPEKLQGKLLTEIEEMVTEELNKPAPPPDWKINVQLIKLFADNGNYDTHNVNYVVLPNGDMTCSIGEGRIFRVTAEDITGNSSAYLKHDDIIVRTIPTAPMQDILDEVHHILVCDYQQAIYLWDIPHVMRWANVPASDKQKALIQRLARKKKRKDIQVNDLSKYEASVLIGQMTG